MQQSTQLERRGSEHAAVSRPLTRRRFLQLGGTTLTGLMLAACAVPSAPAGTGDAATDATITLQVLNNNWGELYNGLMENIGKDFTAANPNVEIDWTFEEEWKTKLLTLVAGGTPPDAAYTNWQAQANLAEKNTFIPLDSYIETTGLKREDFVVSMYDASVWENKLYAVPGGADYLALYWNKDVYADAGLDPEAPPQTADQLMEQAEAMLQVDADGNLARVGYIPDAAQYIQWVYLFGGEFYDEENQAIIANNEVNVQVLEWLMEYIRKLDINKLAAFNSSRPGFYEAGNPFATKQAGTRVDGFWYYDALDQFSPDINYGVALMPTPTGSDEERANYVIQGWMYGLPTGSKQPDAAWDFVRYAFIDESARMGYLTLNGPCVKKAFPDFEAGLREQIGADNRIAPYLDVFTRTGEAGTQHWPNMSVNGFYYDEVTRIWDFVTRGELTPQEGLDQVTANVQAELEKVS